VKYLVLVLIVVASLWWGLNGTDYFKAKPVDAEAAILQSLSENPLNAGKLGVLIEKDPTLTLRLMKDNPMKISGCIKNVRVFGFENNRAEISLNSTPLTEIVVVQDLAQHNLGALQSSSRSHGLRWRVEGGQLFLTSSDGRSYSRMFGSGETFPPTSVQYQKTVGDRKIYLASTAPVSSPVDSKNGNEKRSGKIQQ